LGVCAFFLPVCFRSAPPLHNYSLHSHRSTSRHTRPPQPLLCVPSDIRVSNTTPASRPLLHNVHSRLPTRLIPPSLSVCAMTASIGHVHNPWVFQTTHSICAMSIPSSASKPEPDLILNIGFSCKIIVGVGLFNHPTGSSDSNCYYPVSLWGVMLPHIFYNCGLCWSVVVVGK